jgi:hypothetical protein
VRGVPTVDPEQALRDAETQLEAGEATEALTLLEAYWTWRRNGGFEPKGGDARARRVARAVQRLVVEQQGRSEEGQEGEGHTPEA